MPTTAKLTVGLGLWTTSRKLAPPLSALYPHVSIKEEPDIITQFENADDRELVRAILDSNPEAVLQAVNQGANPKACSKNGISILMLAVQADFPEEKLPGIINHLIENGADVNYQRISSDKKQSETALTYAFTRKQGPNLAAIRALLKNNATPSPIESLSNSPSYMQLKIMERLLLSLRSEKKELPVLSASPSPTKFEPFTADIRYVQEALKRKESEACFHFYSTLAVISTLLMSGKKMLIPTLSLPICSILLTKALGKQNTQSSATFMATLSDDYSIVLANIKALTQQAASRIEMALPIMEDEAYDEPSACFMP